MISEQNIGSLIGSTVTDSDGDKIGTVGQVYLDPDTGRPNWVTVKTGLFGTSETFVPLEQADEAGGGLRVPFDKATVKDAPRIDTDGELSQAEEDNLYAYYHGPGRAGSGEHSHGTTGASGTTTGHDTSGPNTDDAITRSEERLHVGTEREETGRARLRKYVVTENQDVTVPVSHEEVRLEREPITDANVGKAMSGPDLSEEEHEVVLTEERPVVQKETVPVERVRLDKETVTENERVNAEVRKEEVELDGDAGTSGRTGSGI